MTRAGETRIAAFVDDITLMTEEPEKIKIYNEVMGDFKKISGLKVNEDKSEYLRVGDNREKKIEEAGGMKKVDLIKITGVTHGCLLYTSPSPRDATLSRMPSSA